jgi:hypothetical protein
MVCHGRACVYVLARELRVCLLQRERSNSFLEYTLQMDVSPALHPAILGPAGQHLRDIADATGTTCVDFCCSQLVISLECDVG